MGKIRLFQLLPVFFLQNSLSCCSFSPVASDTQATALSPADFYQFVSSVALLFLNELSPSGADLRLEASLLSSIRIPFLQIILLLSLLSLSL